jgi:hypothetical protein
VPKVGNIRDGNWKLVRADVVAIDVAEAAAREEIGPTGPKIEPVEPADDPRSHKERERT